MYRGYQSGIFQTGIGLRGVNCIYDDGTVIPLDAGPCQDVLDNGSYLVDTDNQSQSIEVTTPYPSSSIPMVLGLALLTLYIGGTRVSWR